MSEELNQPEDIGHVYAPAEALRRALTAADNMLAIMEAHVPDLEDEDAAVIVAAKEDISYAQQSLTRAIALTELIEDGYDD